MPRTYRGSESWTNSERSCIDALFFAAEEGNVMKCSQLISVINSFNVKISMVRETKNLVYTALRAGHVDIAKLLIDSGADINSSFEGETLLTWLIKNEGPEMAKSLVNLGVDVNISSPKGSPLEAALLGGDTDLAEFLIDHGANIRFVRHDGQTALSIAAFNGAEELVGKIQLLLTPPVVVEAPAAEAHEEAAAYFGEDEASLTGVVDASE